ncbi:MAG TPA: hypothetical protein VFP53_08610 [Sphingomicrobium sp.]|nr:hypothetical protein [Sphingomicrobium sp.]
MKHWAIDSSATAPAAGPRAPGGPGLRVFAPLALCVAAAVAIQSLWIPLDCDVSWLITVSERVLAGDRLYVDIVEVNPPASVWLYLPLVWAARVIAVRPEAVVAAGFVAGAIASVLATLRLASKLDPRHCNGWLATALGFVALVLPMGLFAQREHAALLFALPALAALAVIAQGRPLRSRTSIACGIAAGLVIAIKPPFALAILAPAAWVIWKRRSARPLLSGIASAVAVVTTYAAAVMVFASAYLDWVPVFAHSYFLMHSDAWRIVVGPLLFPAISLAIAVLVRPSRIPPLAVVLVLGSAGFALAAIIQMKNYYNHWLPGSALALLALFLMLAPGIATVRRGPAIASAAVLALAELGTFVIIPDARIEVAIRRVAPPAPTMIALSPQLAMGHPVTRNVGGRWVGSRPSLFTASAARLSPDDPIAARAYRDDIDSFAADVRRNAPDVILVDRRSARWLMAEPAVKRAMAAYRPAERVDYTEIWLPGHRAR